MNSRRQKTINRKPKKPHTRRPPSRHNREDTNTQEHFRTIGNSSDVIPNSIISILRYSDTSLVRLTSASNYSVYSYRLNDLYDPDPLLASGSISGFNSWCNFYQKWRVHHVSYAGTFINLNTAPVTIFTFASPQGTVPGSVGAAINFQELPWSSPSMVMGPAGTSTQRAHINRNISLAKLYGNTAEYKAQFNYVGNGTTSPSSPGSTMYLVVIAFSSSPLTSGIYTTSTLKYQSNFFDKVVLLQ